ARRGSRQAQPLRRLGKAARFNDLGEDLNGGEAVHPFPYYPAQWNNLLFFGIFIPIFDTSTLPRTQLAAGNLSMKRQLVTAAALFALAVTAVGAVQVTAQDSRVVCIPPAVIQALS